MKQKSFFLFGARSTGKTSLIRQQLPDARVYDLLHSPTFQRLSRRPELIGETLTDSNQIIVIDEIQRLPELLNEVHRLIESKLLRFLLTGSSARGLRKGGVNLLAGRAWEARLFPLTSNEISDFSLERYLQCGGLPQVYSSENPFEELKAYTGTYLQEEIRAESAVRELRGFTRFLDLAATKVGEEVNRESLASDCGVGPKAIKNYFEILEDTLIGFHIPPFQKTVQRKSVSRQKFYFFDIGVTNSLLGRSEIPRSTETYGKVFEQFIILEIKAFLSYFRNENKLTFWRTHSQQEVDCVVGNDMAIEIKSTDLVNERHLKGLKVLREEGLIKNYCVISHDPEERVIDGIKILPWKLFLERLWKAELF